MYCKVERIVTINDDHTISDDCGLPQTDCWFHIDGQLAYTKGFKLLSLIVTERDGDLVFYPLRNHRVHGDSTTKFKNLEGHYIDLCDVSKLDEELIRRTIFNYLNGSPDGLQNSGIGG
jgi:hypothetical protein